MKSFFHPWLAFYGDLHNHCSIGYGHGSLEESLKNAAMQLDFVCVTPHAWWPDLPSGEPRLQEVVDYHRRGFEIASRSWSDYLAAVEAHNQPGKLAVFAGFEWHSMEYGDHHIVYRGQGGEILPAGSLPELRAALRQKAANGQPAMAIPHHIGYLRGYRGINWEAFSPEFSPIVEIMSMHGASESDEAPYPYLHTMGPRNSGSTYHSGLSMGYRVGAIGSTDHHSAHPGSYGHGRAGVWASSASREAVWEAILARRTWALTGDRIGLMFTVNGAPMGSETPLASERRVKLLVDGGDAIDNIELLYCNRVVQRWHPAQQEQLLSPVTVKIHIEVGWGERNKPVEWDGMIRILDGELLDVEARFRGAEVVAPQEKDQDSHAFSSCNHTAADTVVFHTRTWGNLTTTTASTQGVCLEISGSMQTRLHLELNGQKIDIKLMDLLQGSQAGYLGTFLSPGWLIHKAAPVSQTHLEAEFLHQPAENLPGWYTLRVRQQNHQYAWSSPVWVG